MISFESLLSLTFLVSEAASDLLDGLSMYGGEKSGYSDYLKKASTYLDQYGQKHEVKPSGGRYQD